MEYKKFIKLLDSYGGKYNSRDIFRDFVVMLAIAIKNRVYYEQKYEDQYLKIMQKYSKQEMEVFLLLADELIYLLFKGDKLRDVLGEIYQQIGSNSNRIGQVFTPGHVANAMAEMTINTEEVKKNDYILIGDPTCGSGMMLIASANKLRNDNINYCEKVFMIGQDLDFICVCMTYIQVSLYGIPAAIIYGNTLTQENIDIFYTPQYVIGDWYEKLKTKRKEEYKDGKK